MLYDKKLQEKGLSTVHIAKLIVNIKRREDALALGLPYEDKWQRTTLESSILFVNRARGLSQSPPCVCFEHPELDQCSWISERGSSRPAVIVFFGTNQECSSSEQDQEKRKWTSLLETVFGPVALI